MHSGMRLKKRVRFKGLREKLENNALWDEAKDEGWS